MKNNDLYNFWLQEEQKARIHGWDFSYLDQRYQENRNSIPWDMKEIIYKYLTNDSVILDIDTGGGEFLLSLKHPYTLTYATEGYLPNVALCKKELLPLGIHFKQSFNYDSLPFEDETFDIIINRHGDYHIDELHRLLKPGGIFITQQVGEDNDRDLVDLLLPHTPKPFPGNNLSTKKELFLNRGFKINYSDEAYDNIEFFDTGALVWFARILEWEFPNFSVETCYKQLMKVEEIIKKEGSLVGRTHRFIIVAQKPK